MTESANPQMRSCTSSVRACFTSMDRCVHLRAPRWEPLGHGLGLRTAHYCDRVRIATWNVNSLRTRIDRVEALLERHDIDVLALQETKAREDQLPLMGLQALGYDAAVAGVDQWNGVAVISRVGIDDVEVGFEGQPSWGEPAGVEARAIGVTCGDVRVWSLYVPNGRKVDDPHYHYKLDWLARLKDTAHGWRDADTALVGDWNIAPF